MEKLRLTALGLVASVAIACADGNAPVGIGDDVPEDVLQVQERLEVGVPRTTIGHFFGADGRLGTIRSEGIYRPDPSTPKGEKYIREWVREVLGPADTELLLRRMRQNRQNVPGGHGFTLTKTETSSEVESVPLDEWLRMRARMKDERSPQR